MPPTTSAPFGEKGISSGPHSLPTRPRDLKQTLILGFVVPTLGAGWLLFLSNIESVWPRLLIYASLVGLSYFLLSRWLIRELELMTSGTSRIAEGDLNHRLVPSHMQEFRRLASGINHMAGQLTERLQQIEQEGNQTRSLLDSLPDSVLAFNMDGELTYLNPAARHTLRLENQEAIGRHLAASWEGLITPQGWGSAPREIKLPQEDPGKKLLNMAQALADRGGGEVRLGAQRVYRVTIIPYREAERAGQILVLRDMTDLRRLEEVRTLFLSAVSHELRTPLTIIKGFAITLLDHPAAAEDPTLQKPLVRIDQESDRLTRLVNDLLDLTRLQSQRISLELRPTEPESIIEETLGLLTPLAERQKIHLQARLTESGKTVLADRDRIKQILINLVDNAIKFSPDGGAVTVTSEFTDKQWLLTIQDQGPGVPAKELSHLFEHFFRGRQSRKVTGSGLGLAIVKEIVELHLGSIRATSRTGEAAQNEGTSGLTVHVRIPLDSPLPKAESGETLSGKPVY